MSTHAEFWQRVDQSAGGAGCWPWTGGVGTHGYGVSYDTEPGRPKRQVLAHRRSLELTEGPPAERQEALHSCDNKLCCNPKHLRWGSHADNMAEAAERHLTFAPNAGRPACPHGHVLSAANVLHKTKRYGFRTYRTAACRECNRIYLANRRASRRAA